MHEVSHKLAGHDRRSIGKSNEVVSDVIRDPSLFGLVFNGMLSDDPLTRMRLSVPFDDAISIRYNNIEFHIGHKYIFVQVGRFANTRYMPCKITDDLSPRTPIYCLGNPLLKIPVLLSSIFLMNWPAEQPSNSF